jgi:hypothetical protein
MLPIRVGRETIRLDVAAIDWIDAAGDYMCVHAASQTHVLRATMKELEEMLDPEVFQRVHRSTIVNLARVRSLRPHLNGECFLKLESGQEVKLSRSFRDKVELPRLHGAQGIGDFPERQHGAGRIHARAQRGEGAPRVAEAIGLQAGHGVQGDGLEGIDPPATEPGRGRAGRRVAVRHRHEALEGRQARGEVRPFEAVAQAQVGEAIVVVLRRAPAHGPHQEALDAREVADGQVPAGGQVECGSVGGLGRGVEGHGHSSGRD